MISSWLLFNSSSDTATDDNKNCECGFFEQDDGLWCESDDDDDDDDDCVNSPKTHYVDTKAVSRTNGALSFESDNSLKKCKETGRYRDD